ELLPECFRSIAFIRRDALEPFAGTAPCPRVHLNCIKQRQHLCSLVSVGWRGAVRQGHAVAFGEAVDEAPLAFPPRAMPSPPPLPGGKRAIHGTILPANHPTFFSNTENPRLHGGQGPRRLPPLQPAMRRTLGSPLRPTRDIAPATTRD